MRIEPKINTTYKKFPSPERVRLSSAFFQAGSMIVRICCICENSEMMSIRMAVSA